MSLDRVYVSHKNSLNIKVNFEHTQERATASALIDSGVTENFIDIQTAEWWELPRKVLPRLRPIVNVDGTENKAGMVTEACILEVLHNKKQHLQRFYVTNLGFDRVLLEYPWLSTFSPQIDWKTGQVEGEVTLRTMASAWIRWKELRKAALVAEVQVNRVEVEEREEMDEEWEVARTNFVQDWAREANKNEAKIQLYLLSMSGMPVSLMKMQPNIFHLLNLRIMP